jgi:hypothetical protein
MESLLLFRRAFSSPTMCRFIPALSVTRISRLEWARWAERIAVRDQPRRLMISAPAISLRRISGAESKGGKLYDFVHSKRQVNGDQGTAAN